MNEFENKKFEGIYYSRFIASYVKVAGEFYRDEFMSWLKQLVISGKTMPDEIVREITYLATNGKLELESNARAFLKK